MMDPDNPEFELFPGYNNLGDNNEILDPRNSDGLPDKFVPINGSDIDILIMNLVLTIFQNTNCSRLR